MTNQLYGNVARYFATPPTLTDGDYAPLRVDVNGALVTTGANVSSQIYTASNFTPTRTFDATAATLPTTNAVLATLITDLKTAGILQ